MEASNIVGFRADLVYNTALCFYLLKDYGQSLNRVADIVERGIREHPGTDKGTTTC